jgi:hypothetical protein
MVIKRDFRTLAPATQAELRRVAVAMVRAGKTRVEAAETVGVNRRFVGQCAGFWMPAHWQWMRRHGGAASESLQGRNPRWAAWRLLSMAI